MTHYLRNNDNKTVVDVQTTQVDIRCVIVIKEYSALLLAFGFGDPYEFIDDMSQLQELRGEWFENPNQKETPDEFVEKRLKAIAEKWDMVYATD